MKDRRLKLIGDIFNHATLIGSNKSTLTFLLATMTDKALTKFHKEYITSKTDNVQPTIDSDAKK